MRKRNWLWLFGMVWIATLPAQAEPPRAAAPAGNGRFGAIVGRVANSSGVAQAGVPVTLTRDGGGFVKKAVTASNGQFDLSRLMPGLYVIEVVQASFIPFSKGPIVVPAGAQISLDINLWSLAESVEFGAPEKPSAAREQWKWVLRSSYPPRPILRFLEQTAPGPVSVPDARERALRGTVQFLAGNDSHGFGTDPGVRTAFDMRYELTGSSGLGLAGSAGWERGTPAAGFRTAWSHRSAEETTSTVSATARQLFLPSDFFRNEATEAGLSRKQIQSFTVGYENERWLGSQLHLQYGSLYDTVTLVRRMKRWSPFGRLTYAPNRQTRLTLAYTGANPRVLPSEGEANRLPMEQWLAIPQLSSAGNGSPVLEDGKHVEAAWEQRLGDRYHFQTAAFYDALSDVAVSLAFVGSTDLASSLLRDPFSHRYFLSGGDYSSGGARAALGAAISKDSEVVVSYSYGGGLQALSQAFVAQNAQMVRSWIRTHRGHSFGVKVISKVPLTHTEVTTSYRWIPRNSVVPPDPYDRGFGRDDPYLNVVLSQPLPSPDILPGQFEAIADFTNLLAQGYLIVRTPNGSGQLFPVARSFRGGFSFIF